MLASGSLEPGAGRMTSSTRMGRDHTWMTPLVSPSSQAAAGSTPFQALERLKICQTTSRTRFRRQAHMAWQVSPTWMPGTNSPSPKALATFCSRLTMGVRPWISWMSCAQETLPARSARPSSLPRRMPMMRKDMQSAMIFMKCVRNRSVVRHVSYLRMTLMSYSSFSCSRFSACGRNHLWAMWKAASWQGWILVVFLNCAGRSMSKTKAFASSEVLA
mmetsp:Transcript_18234/g.57978  ORF Transcript_18234/g.57978 Transcript_18234/m.57978 type:complete len:217 (-) Transcript_18234:1059-1709(-)